MRKGEFVITPMVSAGLFGAAPDVWLFVIGVAVWTFIEYAVHRTLHEIHWLYGRVHHRHHAHPNEEPPPVFWPFWASLAVALVPLFHVPLALLGGVTAGFAWFSVLHRDCHASRDDVAPSLLDHHDKHHHAHPRANFGVSTRLWDVLFRTAA